MLSISTKLAGHHDVSGKNNFNATSLGISNVTTDGVQLIDLEQAGTHLVALCGKEGEDHAATDQDCVHAREQVRNHTELVRNFGTTKNNRVGPLRVFGQSVQYIEFSLDEQTCCAGNQLGQVIDRSLLAVNDAKTVRDEHVTKLGKLCSECATLSFVLGSLPWVKSQVL